MPKAFAHVPKKSPLRKEIAQKIRGYRDIEQGKYAYTWQTTRMVVSPFEPIKGMDVFREAETMHKRLGRPVRVFEVGAGSGYSLRAIKTYLHNLVEVDGITLTQKAASEALGKEEREGHTILATQGLAGIGGSMLAGDIPGVKLRVGLIEGLKLHGQDLIFSFQSMRYVIDRARALEVIANGLNQGGKAILHVPPHFLGKDEYHIREQFERRGFRFRVRRVQDSLKVPKWMKTQMQKEGQGTGKKRILTTTSYFIEIERMKDQNVDLRPYYKIRTHDRWQDPGRM